MPPPGVSRTPSRSTPLMSVSQPMTFWSFFQTSSFDPLERLRRYTSCISGRLSFKPIRISPGVVRGIS